MEIIYYCPKCKSEEVEVVCLNPPSPIYVSMDYIKNSGQVQPDNLVYYHYQYQATCKDCGYSVEFSK